MEHRGEGTGRNPHRWLEPLSACLALWLAVLGGLAPSRLAAQEAAPPAAQQPDSATPQPADSAAPQPGTAAPPPDTGTQPPPDTGTPPPPESGQAPPKKPHDGVSAGMTAAKLLIVDVREVIRSPEHWHRGDWALFGTEVAAVVAVGAFDESLQRDVRRPKSAFADSLAKDTRTFGNYGSFEVLGGFYLAGLLAHDKRAQETTLDGLFASGIAGGLISPFLKVVVGRNRPNANKGAYDFHPFSLKVSFPSGEATQAFAVASVISTHYPNPWVELLCYTTAAATSWGRVRQNGHWVSDSLAGALIGFHVGRTVVHINQRLRARVAFTPLIGPGTHGAAMTASF
ncbi:MAG TPA: phosphatase PAP2 family protein [Thermoanaerobaculia bacterium]|nr:phosphatase PAP2 family protein [Thermoanaerobaculia bacterium]